MTNLEVLVLIPARFNSTRFPGKPLAKIAGVSMIQRVYQNCQKSGFGVAVVTDDIRIKQHVESFGGRVCMVEDVTSSGTERIYLAYQREFRDAGVKYVVNVQGDEPLLTGDDLKRLVTFHKSSGFDIATIVEKKSDRDDSIENPNSVKVIFSKNGGRCLYFSRAPIPFHMEKEMKREWYKHIGVYSYTTSAIERFCSASPSNYERLERLEQLRALELGLTIGAVTCETCLVGVDIPEDVARVEGVLSGKGC